MLLEINTVNFLYKLSQKYKKLIKIKDVPLEEWEKLSYNSTVKYIWLMGIWKRSKLSKKISL
ncbi:MAG: alpha-amylase, partial [bacterium]